jgi:hypothetical protein
MGTIFNIFCNSLCYKELQNLKRKEG